jgi:ABC-2 type transport system ATP-binding protein
VQSLQALLGRLTEHSVNAEELSVHTPDLDDVFLALTGRANTGHSTTGLSTTEMSAQ